MGALREECKVRGIAPATAAESVARSTTSVEEHQARAQRNRICCRDMCVVSIELDARDIQGRRCRCSSSSHAFANKLSSVDLDSLRAAKNLSVSSLGFV